MHLGYYSIPVLGIDPRPIAGLKFIRLNIYFWTKAKKSYLLEPVF